MHDTGSDTVTGVSKTAAPPPRVLVVEDDALIRYTLRLELQEARFSVLDAPNAEAAMESFACEPRIAAVVTDVRMPGVVDGVGLAKWMRSHAPGVPIVLVSGYPMQSQLLEVNPAIAIVVRKPYDPREIVGWLSSLLLLD